MKLRAALVLMAPLIAVAVVGCSRDGAPKAPAEPFRTKLTPREKLQVVAVAEASAIVRKVIGESQSTIGEPGLWQSESGETIGGVVPITLQTPVSIPAGSIPVFEAPCRVPPLIVPSMFRAENVTSITAYVDFGVKSVVAIVPNGKSIYPHDYKPCPGGGD